MDKFFTTSAGLQIETVPVPPLLIEEVRLQAMKEVEVPPVPTYQVELLDGTSLTYEHDENSIADPTTTDADKKLWQKYQTAREEQQRHSSTKVMELFMVKGTKISKEEIEGGEWLEMQKYFGLSVPDNWFALKVHYLRTELLNTVDDIYGMMAQIVEMSGIDKTILQAAKNSFRSELRQETDTVEGFSGAESVEPEGPLAHELPILRNGSGEKLGVDASAMGR